MSVIWTISESWWIRFDSHMVSSRSFGNSQERSKQWYWKWDNERLKPLNSRFMNIGTLLPCFSIYLSSRNPKKATELTEESLPVHNNSNIKLNTVPAFAYLLFTLHVKKINGWPQFNAQPDRFAWHWLCQWRGLLTDYTNCVLSMTEWLVRISFRTHKFRIANMTRLPLRIFVSRKPWLSFAECSLRNTAVLYKVSTFVFSWILQHVAFFPVLNEREGCDFLTLTCCVYSIVILLLYLILYTLMLHM